MKNAVTAVLLLFVAASVVYLVASETRKPTGDAESAPTVASAASPGKGGSKTESVSPKSADARREETVAYYFHGTARCPTCLKMERYAREAIEETFAAETDAGLIEWRAVNYDEPANEHFVKEHGLTASALVVVAASSGGPKQWRNLDRIWDLVNDEAAFKAYVVDVVTAMLRGES